MPVTDPIADLLTRIRNASNARKDEVEVPYSKLKLEICRILKEEGYIKAVFWNNKGKSRAPIKLFLRYGAGSERVIHGINRVSRPGLRTYKGVSEIPRVLGGMGVSIVSTSSGLLTDKDCRKRNIGGEILCSIW